MRSREIVKEIEDRIEYLKFNIEFKERELHGYKYAIAELSDMKAKITGEVNLSSNEEEDDESRTEKS